MADNKKLFNGSKFNFVGTLTTSKEPVSVNKMGQSKWSKTRMGAGIRVGTNTQFLHLEYIHTESVNTCKLMGKDGEQFECSFEDTVKPETIEKVADFAKVTIDLETDFEKKREYTSLMYKIMNHEKKDEKDKTEEDAQKIAEYKAQIKELATNRIEFCHMKDAIKFLNARLPIFDKKKVKVTGNVKSNYYKGQNRLEYHPSLIEIVDDSTEEHLTLNIDFFYTKEGLKDNEKIKRMLLSGYVGEKIKKVDKLFPLNIVFDYTKVDFDNPQHAQLVDFIKGNFKINDKQKVHKLGLELTIINGSPTIEFTEDNLTTDQKMAIQLGLNKLEDFKPRGNVYGDRIQELRLVKPNLREYTAGGVESFDKKLISNFLVKDDSDVKASEVNNTPQEPEAPKEENPTQSAEDLMKQLFSN